MKSGTRKAFIALAVTVVAIVLLATVSDDRTTVTFFASGGEVELRAEVASGPLDIQRGLMFIEGLGPEEGMLFVFGDEQERNFWMKNTLIPLDIIFISAGKEVVSIANAVPCMGDPCPHYPSRGPAKYVVEVNTGFTEANLINVGDKVDTGGY